MQKIQKSILNRTLPLFLAILSFNEYKQLMRQSEYSSKLQVEVASSEESPAIHLSNSMKIEGLQNEASKDQNEMLDQKSALKMARSNFFIFQLGRKVTPF